jgi:hypothetical protein
MQRGLRVNPTGTSELFRTYDWDVEVSLSVKSKIAQFDWGLLQGMLEARRADALTE